MIREIIYDNLPLPLYRNAMDAYAARHRATASNIANGSNPNYVPMRVEFEKQLADAMNRGNGVKTSHPTHLPGKDDYKQVRHTAHRAVEELDRNGNNDLEVEREAHILLTNQINYALVAKRAGRLFEGVRRLSMLK